MRLRTGPNKYVRTGDRITCLSPTLLPKDLEEVSITLRIDAGNWADFIYGNQINYLAIARLPSPDSGYFIGDCYVSHTYAWRVCTTISPFVFSSGGSVLSFRHRERSAASFFVVSYCYGETTKPDSLRVEKDLSESMTTTHRTWYNSPELSIPGLAKGELVVSPMRPIWKVMVDLTYGGFKTGALFMSPSHGISTRCWVMWAALGFLLGSHGKLTSSPLLIGALSSLVVSGDFASSIAA